MTSSTLWARVRSFAAAVTSRRRLEREMAEELAFHVDARAADLEDAGLTAADARRQARMELGSVDTVREDCRASLGLRIGDALGQDLRQAFRGLATSRGFAVTSIATLAVCVGANLAIFAVVDAVLLRALPFPAAERLVEIYNTYPRANVLDDGSSVTNYYERRGQLAAVERLSIYRERAAIVGNAGAAEREPVSYVSAEFFETLGVTMAIGTAPGEDAAAAGPVVVTAGYWRQQLAADPAVIGRTLRVDGVPRAIAAVLPESFSFLSSESRLYLPLVTAPAQRTSRQRHSGSSTRMIGRLAPGASLADAQAQLDAHNAVMEQDNPQAARMADAGFRSLVMPLRAYHVAAVRPVLLLLQAGALLLLLIGVVNLTNVCLVRASGRLPEMAVRHALGVSRTRIVSQVLVETSTVTVAGGLLGLALGAAGIRGLAALGADRLPMAAHIAFDARLALVALVAAAGLGVALGAPIAWFHLRSYARIAARFEGRGGTGSRAAHRLRSVFAVAQTALAFVLLGAAGLLATSLSRTLALDAGFSPAGAAAGRLTLTATSYPTADAMLGAAERLIAGVAAEPGVTAAALATNVPLSGLTIKSATTVVGYEPAPNASPRGHYAYGVTGDYFTALGIPLREGRTLTADDSHRAAPACVVDDDYARRYWPGRSAVGQQVFLGSRPAPTDVPCTVVGVVGAVKQAGLVEDDAAGAIYVPYRFNADRQVFVVARGRGAASGLAGRLAPLARQVDPDLAMDDVRPMQARLDQHLVTRRSPATLAALFSGVALLLTALGLYGLVSFAVAERRREIGVRMALGARPAQVGAVFLRQGLVLLAAGGAVGWPRRRWPAARCGRRSTAWSRPTPVCG
ncbi:MAG: ABC transporter permease [Vicinamibacterales bacterium]